MCDNAGSERDVKGPDSVLNNTHLYLADLGLLGMPLPCGDLTA